MGRRVDVWGITPTPLTLLIHSQRASSPLRNPRSLPCGHGGLALGRIQEPPNKEPTPPPPLFPDLLPAPSFERRSVPFVALFEMRVDAG